MSEELLVEGYEMLAKRDITVYYSSMLTNGNDLPDFIEFDASKRAFTVKPINTEDIGTF